MTSRNDEPEDMDIDEQPRSLKDDAGQQPQASERYSDWNTHRTTGSSVEDPPIVSQPLSASTVVRQQTGGGEMDVDHGWNTGSDNRPTSMTHRTSLNSDAQTERPPQSPTAMPEPFNVGEGTSNENTGRKAELFVLDWPQDEPLQKRLLQKALQTWFNKNENMPDTSCTIESLSDLCAEVIIQPASALEHLLVSQEIILPVKGKKTAKIQFLPAAEIKTHTPDSSSLAVHSPLPSAAQDVKPHMDAQSTAADPRGQKTDVSDPTPQRGQETEANVPSPQRGQETEVNLPSPQRGQETEVNVPSPQRGQETEFSVPFPMSHFVYLNQAYREEMKRIERENGVSITAELKVSFEVDQKNNRSSLNPERALAEFTNLAQQRLGDFGSVTVPLKHADQGDWKRMLQNIQREESKLVLTASCGEMTVSGPSKSVGEVRQSLQIPQSSFSDAPSQQDRHRTTQEIGMVKKDPSVSGGLTVDKCHWTVITTTLGKTLADIKTKYNVSLEPEKLSRDKITVRVKPASSSSSSAVASNSLESHAFRALLRLYQKVVTSTMSSSLQLPDQEAQKVADKLQDKSALHHGVGVQDDHGSWTVLGSSHNQTQGPTPDAVQRELGKPVFKEHDKIGHLSYSNETSAGTATVAGATAETETKEKCPICMENGPQMEKLKCGHELCTDCKIQMVEKMGPVCPVCKDVFGKIEGDQPHGSMTWNSSRYPLPGFPRCGTITINYNIPGGTQTEKHPNPGKHYYGTQRTAYLPDNNEGKEVVRLLKKAFDQKLIFTVGTSVTTGNEDQVTWNDIHHKTNMSGGPQGFGYPDDGYLSRVKAELKAKGIE